MSERYYSTINREFLGLKWSVEKFYHYTHVQLYMFTEYISLYIMTLNLLLKGKSRNQKQASYQINVSLRLYLT